MRAFLAGVLSTVAVLVLALVLLILSLPLADSRPSTPVAPASPTGAPSAVAAGETWLGDADLTSSSVLTSDGPLTDVHATGTGVRLTAKGLRADRLQVAAVLPFATAARQIGNGVELYDAGQGRAGLRRTATIFGRDLTIKATGTVRAEGGQLLIEPETVDVGGPSVLSSVLSSIARQLATIRHTVTGLPAGMRLTAVTVEQDGFGVRLEGTGVAITS